MILKSLTSGRGASHCTFLDPFPYLKNERGCVGPPVPSCSIPWQCGRSSNSHPGWGESYWPKSPNARRKSLCVWEFSLHWKAEPLRGKCCLLRMHMVGMYSLFWVLSISVTSFAIRYWLALGLWKTRLHPWFTRQDAHTVVTAALHQLSLPCEAFLCSLVMPYLLVIFSSHLKTKVRDHFSSLCPQHLPQSLAPERWFL